MLLGMLERWSSHIAIMLCPNASPPHGGQHGNENTLAMSHRKLTGHYRHLRTHRAQRCNGLGETQDAALCNVGGIEPPRSANVAWARSTTPYDHKVRNDMSDVKSKARKL